MIRSCFLLLISCLAQVAYSQQHIDFDHIDHIAAIELHDVHEHNASNGVRNVDVQKHICHWRVDPGVAWISGNVKTLFKPLESSQQTVHFDLLNSMIVDSIIYQNKPVSYNHANDVLAIDLDQQAAMLDSISIYYHGVPISDGLGTFKADTFQGSPVLWTLSQPYGAPGWWPCNSGLGERIDELDIYLDVPSRFVGVSHGLLVDSSSYGNRIVYHWQHKHSIPTYLVAFAVGDYAFYESEISLPDGTVPFHNYIYKQSDDSFFEDVELTEPLMQLYDSLLGPYPYIDEKYGHVQFNRGGGMEHTTISFMGNLNVYLIAHELIHHWVGNLVTCASWQELWLNEGITTFLTGVMFDDLIGGGDWKGDWRRGAKERSLREPNGVVFASDTTSVLELFSGNLRYYKPAFTMHMLRNQLGDSAFFSGLKNYLSDPDLVNGFATESDLKRHLETTSSQDLSWFFEQWIHQPGYPVITASWKQAGNQIEINWEQQSSAENGFIYRMPLSFTAYYGNQQETINFETDEQKGKAVIVVSGPVDSIQVDAENQVMVGVDTIMQTFISNPITVFPNPSRTHVTIQLGNNLDTIERIELVDSQGRVHYTATAISSYYLELNVSTWPAGVYHGSVKSASGVKKEISFIVQ